MSPVSLSMNWLIWFALVLLEARKQLQATSGQVKQKETHNGDTGQWLLYKQFDLHCLLTGLYSLSNPPIDKTSQFIH